MEVPAEEPEETNAAPELGNASYDFSVAEDGNGGTASTTVNISVTDVDETAEAGASSWEITITVGEYGDWQGTTDPSVALGNPAGSLDSVSFDWDGTAYQVRRLLDSGDGDQMGIEFTTDMPSDTTGIVLRVDGLDLSFHDAPIRTDAFIQWTLDNTWTLGSVLKVELLRPQPTTPPPDG